jgi:hypothetical protein
MYIVSYVKFCMLGCWLVGNKHQQQHKTKYNWQYTYTVGSLKNWTLREEGLSKIETHWSLLRPRIGYEGPEGE